MLAGLGQLWPSYNINPKGSKVRRCDAQFRVSILGIVILVSGRYLHSWVLGFFGERIHPEATCASDSSSCAARAAWGRWGW